MNTDIERLTRERDEASQLAAMTSRWRNEAEAELAKVQQRQQQDYAEVGRLTSHCHTVTARAEAAEAELAKVREALLWIDHYEPELVATAEKKFGLKLFASKGTKT